MNEPLRLVKIKPNLLRRTLIYNGIRAFFRQENFLEVETPIRIPTIIPEKYIIPFSSDGWFLSTSPEIYMKQLIAAGYGNIFQLCHCFRKDERGENHQPEFAMLEWYRVHANYEQIISDTERLIYFLANELGITPTINYQDNKIDLTPPWSRITVREAFINAAGWDPFTCPDDERFDIDLMEKVVPSFTAFHPTILCDYPAALASLSRLKPGKTEVAERAEIFIGGLEIANIYSELTDALEQEQRFKTEIEQLKSADIPNIVMPTQFLMAVAHLPECSGIALGIDRLVMLFCNAKSINEVIAFPN